MSRFTAVAVLVLCATAAAAPAPEVVRAGDGPVAAMDLVELDVHAGRSWSDPFDRGQVAVDAVFRLGEREWWVEGFWYQGYAASRMDGAEVLEAQGDPRFRVRFRPPVAGVYEVEVTVTDTEGTTEPARLALDVGDAASGRRGFLGRDPADPRRLAWTDGTPYVPFGVNLDWVGPGGTGEFHHYFDRFLEHGLDWTRVWMTHFDGTALEWLAGADGGGYQGLGRYNLKAAWRVDQVLALAEEHGVALQLVLQQHSQFECGKWSSWNENPWNAANGGPLARSADFFTQADVVALFDRKVHYLVARYAHSPALLAWELFNEVELIHGYVPDVGEAWMRARADLIRSLDPYGHLVTTSWAMPGTPGARQDWAFEGYGLTQLHTYIPMYMQTIEIAASYLVPFGKPAIVAEFGIDYLGELNLRDTRGAHLHNATLMAALSGFQGGAMTWWWDSYVEKLDLWGAVGAPARALRAAGIRDWTGYPAGAVLVPDDAALAVRAAGTGDGAIAWVHEVASDWDAPEGYVPPLRQGVLVRLEATQACPGTRTVRAWDTWTGGEVAGAGVAEAAGGGVDVALPPFRADVLVRVGCLPAPVPEAPEAVAEATPEVPEPVPARAAGGCTARF